MTRRERIHEVIFEADSPAGRIFDIALLVAILLSVIMVMLETTSPYGEKYGNFFHTVEWILTVFFTLEYGLRLYVVKKPLKYATSFYGIIDLLAILPTYIGLFIVGAHSLLVIRALRLLRVFRVFKLVNYMGQGRQIAIAMQRSAAKIALFGYFVLLLVTILGTTMYVIEAGANEQFDSVPRSIYWAIVTLTTVGYGDISPITPLGQFVAAFVMILGYAVIAVPTGIVSAELVRMPKTELNTKCCHNCGREGHGPDASFCKYCGKEL